MRYGFLFSGQGAQYKGMAEDIYTEYPAVQKLIREISTITGENIEDFLFHTENEALSRSDKAQLAITAVEIALLTVLREKGILPSAVAGFSLGEYSALYAAGVLDLHTVITLVQQRGRIMQTACDAVADAGKNGGAAGCGMAAVLKLTPDAVKKVLAPYSGFENGTVFPANMNSPMQTVVSGTEEGLTIAEKLCKEAGAKRFIRLSVAGPFHSPLMRQAADEFEKVLEPVHFADPKIPLFSNVSGTQITTGEEAKKNAVLHITHPVLWTDEEKALAEFTADGSAWQLLEIGPGNTLCNLWRDSGFAAPKQDGQTGISCLPSGTLEQLQKILDLFDN